jgi:hypothetical protein
MLLANFATLATALFTGAAVYISLVEHPARLLCPTAHAVEQWRPSYKRAIVIQVSLAVAGSLLAIAAWLTGAGLVWLLAGRDVADEQTAGGSWSRYDQRARSQPAGPLGPPARYPFRAQPGGAGPDAVYPGLASGIPVCGVRQGTIGLSVAPITGLLYAHINMDAAAMNDLERNKRNVVVSTT